MDGLTDEERAQRNRECWPHGRFPIELPKYERIEVRQAVREYLHCVYPCRRNLDEGRAGVWVMDNCDMYMTTEEAQEALDYFRPKLPPEWNRVIVIKKREGHNETPRH